MSLEEFINGLKRDKARGKIAPHQIILLITLFKIYSETKNPITDITTLNNQFQKIWNLHKEKFNSKNNKVGLPLKAFSNRGYLDLSITNQINDFRNNFELETKISSLKIEPILIQLFQNSDFEKYLRTRITN